MVHSQINDVYNQWTNIVAIFCGRNHKIGLKADGTLVASGFNDKGQCDVSDWEDIKLPENNK